MTKTEKDNHLLKVVAWTRTVSNKPATRDKAANRVDSVKAKINAAEIKVTRTNHNVVLVSLARIKADVASKPARNKPARKNKVIQEVKAVRKKKAETGKQVHRLSMMP